jgi:hypothetical protein
MKTKKQYIHPVAFMPIAPGSRIKKAANGLNLKNVDPTQTDLSGLASGVIGIQTTLAESALGTGEVTNTDERNMGTLGGAISGAGSGASMGASIGLNPALLAATGGLSALAVPVGAIIGGIAGERNKEKEIEAYSASKEDMYRAYGGSLRKYELGGDIDMIQGPGHEQGGVQLTDNVEAEGGEAVVGSEVLSDRLINPETGNTFAKDAEMLKKKYTDRDFDPITSRTQAKQIARLVELNTIERKKMEEMEAGLQEDFMAYGGYIKDNKFDDIVLPFVEDSAKLRGMDVNTYKEKLLALGGNKKMALGGGIYDPTEDPVTGLGSKKKRSGLIPEPRLELRSIVDPLTGVDYVKPPSVFPNDPASAEFDAFFKNKSGQDLKFYQDLYGNQNVPAFKNNLTAVTSNVGNVATTPIENNPENALANENTIEATGGLWENSVEYQNELARQKQAEESALIANEDADIEPDYGEGNLWENSEEGQAAIRRMQGIEDAEEANKDYDIDEAILNGTYNPENINKEAGEDEVNTTNEKLALLMSNLPALDNLARSINPETTRLQTLKAELLDLEPAREANKRSAAMAQANMRENLRGSGNTSGASLAALTAGTTGLSSATQEANLQSFLQEGNANTQIKNSTNAANTQIKNQEQEINAMNKAMSQSLRNLALSDISTNTQGFMKDVKLSKTQEFKNKEVLGIINSIDPNYKVVKVDGVHKIIFQQAGQEKTLELKD